MPSIRSASPAKTAAIRVLLFTAVLSLANFGCAKAPPPEDLEAVEEFQQLNDPLEPMNRASFRVNVLLDEAVLEPVARAYRFAVPGEVRVAADNVLTNLGTPVRLGNDIFAGKPRRAGDTTMRFLINTTDGVLGVFDVATAMGFKSHDSDFGLTLGILGVEEGPFLFVPILGPWNTRDLVGFGVDRVGDPFLWIGQGAAVRALGWSRFSVGAINAREKVLDPIEQIKKTALDPYATFRSLYRQYRASMLKNLAEDERATIPAWFPDRAGINGKPPSR